MSEQTLQEKLQAAVDAQNKGIPVNWQEMCLETYNAAMAEIQRLNALLEPEEETGAE
jgi:hypothetical protein